MITYKQALARLGPRVSRLRDQDPDKDFWKALDRAIEEVGGVEYGPNETRTKLGGKIARGHVSKLSTPGSDEGWGGSD